MTYTRTILIRMALGATDDVCDELWYLPLLQYGIHERMCDPVVASRTKSLDTASSESSSDVGQPSSSSSSSSSSSVAVVAAEVLPLPPSSAGSVSFTLLIRVIIEMRNLPDQVSSSIVSEGDTTLLTIDVTRTDGDNNDYNENSATEFLFSLVTEVFSGSSSKADVSTSSGSVESAAAASDNANFISMNTAAAKSLLDRMLVFT